MIYKDYISKQNAIVTDFKNFKKKCTDESILLNDSYLEEIELCMIDVDDYLSEKRISDFKHYDSNLVFYRYEISGNDVSKFIDLNDKLDTYIGKKAYHTTIISNGKQYSNLKTMHVNSYTQIAIRYFFDKLTTKFSSRVNVANAGEWR